MTKTNHDQVIMVPDFVVSVPRWHVDKQLITRDMERSELLFPSEVGTFRHNSALAKPFKAIANAMGPSKQISPKATRRSFQDANVGFNAEQGPDKAGYCATPGSEPAPW